MPAITPQPAFDVWRFVRHILNSQSVDDARTIGLYTVQENNASSATAEFGSLEVLPYEQGELTQILTTLDSGYRLSSKYVRTSGLAGTAWNLWQRVHPLPSRTIAGLVVAFGYNDVPSTHGWLLCNGQSVSQTRFAELFAFIGTKYGGSATSFNLPDLRGEFTRPSRMGQTGDFETDLTALPVNRNNVLSDVRHSHTFGIAVAGEHHHLGGYPVDPINVAYGTTNDGATTTHRLKGTTHNDTQKPRTSTEPDHTHTTTIDQAGQHSHTWTLGGDAETRPDNIAMPFYISTGNN